MYEFVCTGDFHRFPQGNQCAQVTLIVLFVTFSENVSRLGHSRPMVRGVIAI